MKDITKFIGWLFLSIGSLIFALCICAAILSFNYWHHEYSERNLKFVHALTSTEPLPLPESIIPVSSALILIGTLLLSKSLKKWIIGIICIFVAVHSAIILSVLYGGVDNSEFVYFHEVVLVIVFLNIWVAIRVRQKNGAGVTQTGSPTNQ